MVPSIPSALFATTINGGIFRRAKYRQAHIRVKKKLAWNADNSQV
jgi:hypothetical protein